jgi:hypothetical protein
MATIVDLGKLVKAKYPQYNDLSDYEVGKRVKAKYPTQYADFVDAPDPEKTSTAKKVVNTAKAVGNALTSSEQALGRGLSTVFNKEAQKTADKVNAQSSQDQQAIIDAIRKQADPAKKQHLIDFLKQNWGVDYKAVEQGDINPAFNMTPKQVAGAALGTALDVVSAGSYGKAAQGAQTGVRLTKAANTAARAAEAVDTAKTLTTGQKALKAAKTIAQGAAQGYGYDVAGNLQADKQNFAKPGLGLAIGGGIPLAVAATKGVGFIAKEVAKHTSSALSGVPKAAIEEAFSNPLAVQRAMRTAATDSEGAAQKILADAQDALDSLTQARKAVYEANLAKVPAEASSGKLSTLGVKQTFTKTLKQFGAEGSGRGITFTNVALDDAHISKLQKLQDRIYSWTDTSPVGLNRLKQVVRSYELGGVNLGSSEKKFNAIVKTLEANIGDYVGDRVPEIGRMNRQYRAESEVIDNIVSQLKTNAKDQNTPLRKLLNVFNPKSEVYRPVVRQLGAQGAKNLMADIAGLTMAKWTPEGIAKYLDVAFGGAALVHPASWPGIATTLLAGSPRVVGEVTTAAGRIAQNETARAVARAATKAGRAARVLTARDKGLNK